MSKLNWKLLTKKRDSSTQGLPPGKEDRTRCHPRRYVSVCPAFEGAVGVAEPVLRKLFATKELGVVPSLKARPAAESK